MGREDALYAATDQRERARTELSAAIAMYRTMERTFWLPQTEVALAQVEESMEMLGISDKLRSLNL